MIEELRVQIDLIDRQLVELLASRLEIARKIAIIKKENRLPIFDSTREKYILEEVRCMAKMRGLSSLIIAEIFQLILDETKMKMEGVS